MKVSNSALVFVSVCLLMSTNLDQASCMLVRNDAQSVMTMDQSEGEIADILRLPNVSPNLQCSIPDEEARFDCWPEGDATEGGCQGRGCCWAKAEHHLDNSNTSLGKSIDVPYCFYPKDYNGYTMSQPKTTQFGLSATLSRTTKSGWPNDIINLQLDVFEETPQRLHFKIYDPKNKRYEVPLSTPQVQTKAPSTDYTVKLQQNPAAITVTRTSTGTVLFDSTVAPLIFADQFLQISTHTGTGIVYGLGEHKTAFLKNATWTQFSTWARDQPPSFGSNLYGSHPFFMSVEKDGSFHGVFLLNSNAMDVDIQPLPALTFRTIGGILDFYVFTGPSAESVIKQYTEVIGRPFLPPYWSLGFHLCKYGYGTITETEKVIARNKAIGIPYDVQWNDIDYMSNYLDWTYDKNRFKGLPEMVKDLHDSGMHYVMIVDPGISYTQPSGSYPPYDTGIRLGVFINGSDGQPLHGKVWPGPTVYPDFTNPKSLEWWYESAKSYHDQVSFDGLWTDMNEPSNFVSGSDKGCTHNNLDIPPYVPGIVSGNLFDHTVCPSAKQYLGYHYDLHSLYGHTEVVASNYALKKILNKRSIVISRSSFPGTGHYGGHWSGDITSVWGDLYYSIPVVLNMQMFGIPFVGADICGFAGTTTEELCTRWMQLGSFYPFMRNHNDKHRKDQDPAVWSPSAQQSMKKALMIRYTLLPYLYSLLFSSHVDGGPVARPLVFQYPTDTVTYGIDKQFFWGDGLLISPVLERGATSVKAYFPKDRFYELLTGRLSDGSGSWVTLPADLDTIPLHFRGGVIIPMQKPAVTTTKARLNPYFIVIALSANNTAVGKLYWDDGDSLGVAESKEYTYIEFKASMGKMSSTPVLTGYKPAGGMKLDYIVVMGVMQKTSSVTVNGKSSTFEYDDDSKVLTVTSIERDLLSNIDVQWK